MTAIRNVLIVAAMLGAAGPAFSQTDPHHPAGAAATAPSQSMQGGTPGPGMMNMGDDNDMSGGRMPMMGMMGMMGGRMMGMMEARSEGWLAFLKTELKITDAQSAPWNAFADAVRANAKGMKDMRASMMSQGEKSEALPDRLALHEKMLSTRLDAVRRLKSVALPLYASFNDEQKKTADEILSPMGMMPMGMM